MGYPTIRNLPPRKNTAAPTPARPASALTAAEQKRLAEAMNQMSPKERKRLAKAVKRMTPEQRRQYVAFLKQQLAKRSTAR